MDCKEFVDFHTHLDWYKSAEFEDDLSNKLSGDFCVGSSGGPTDDLQGDSDSDSSGDFRDGSGGASADDLRDNLIEQLRSFKGVIVAASVNAESYKKNLKIAEKTKALGFGVKIIPTVGVHPECAASAEIPENAEDLAKIYNPLLEKSALIGEIGMDFCWYKEASPEKQEMVLRFFLDHCNKTGKYCVIHTKDAEKQICNILKDYPNAKPVIHWYDGPEDVFKEFVKRGYMMTFGCETCRSNHIQKLLRQTPAELILAETDNPTGETWLGGTDNSVNLIKRVYDDIADVIGLSSEHCRKLINANAMRILKNL